MRVCKTCGESKPLTEYHRERGGPGTRNPCYKTSCKPCVLLRVNASMRRLRAERRGAA